MAEKLGVASTAAVRARLLPVHDADRLTRDAAAIYTGHDWGSRQDTRRESFRRSRERRQSIVRAAAHVKEVAARVFEDDPLEREVACA